MAGSEGVIIEGGVNGNAPVEQNEGDLEDDPDLTKALQASTIVS